MKTLSGLVVLSMLGCGGTSVSSLGSGDAGDGGGGPLDGAPGSDAGAVTLAKATADFTDAYCARAAACAPAFVTEGFGDLATCSARFSLEVAAAFAAPGTSLTAAQGEACATALPRASCGDFLGRRLPSPCQTVPGTLAVGAPCGADGQCQATQCRVAPNAVCGTCASPAGAGAACSADADCESGMTCLDQACVTFGQETAACSATAPCRPDLGCVSGACATPLAAGAPCTGSQQCDELHGVFCNPLTTKCEDVSFAAAGGACGLVGGRIVGCTGPGSKCAGEVAPSYEGACLPLAADGAKCDADAGPLCDFAAVCVAGTCEVGDPKSCR